MIINIEDCLECLVGMRDAPATFTVEKTDHTIVNSIARQVFRGIALTDRQFSLMKEKLVNYKEQFVAAGVDNFEYVIEQTRQPLRHIDRTRYIKLVDDKIEIRFPFKKSDIILVEEAGRVAVKYNEYSHTKGSHIHTFDFNEINVMNLMDRFATKEFEIDGELIEIYKKITEVRNNPQDYLSGIFSKQLVNIKPSLAPYISNELGELSNETSVQFVDRRFRYGFDHVGDLINNTFTLENKIALREDATYQSKPSAETTESILGALWKLKRFPLLVILDRLNAETQLYEFANYYRDILDPKEQSVLFRIEDSEAGFNQLVKDRKLNNWVDKNTKVVYISRDKLPKLLINNEWKPTATFSYTSSMDKFVNSYVSFNCDLVVYREENMSPMRRYSNYYG